MSKPIYSTSKLDIKIRTSLDDSIFAWRVEHAYPTDGKVTHRGPCDVARFCSTHSLLAASPGSFRSSGTIKFNQHDTAPYRPRPRPSYVITNYGLEFTADCILLQSADVGSNGLLIIVTLNCTQPYKQGARQCQIVLSTPTQPELSSGSYFLVGERVSYCKLGENLDSLFTDGQA